MDPKASQPLDLRDGIEDLVKSIKKFGLLQPIIVSPLPDGKFQLIAGRRRVFACAMLQMTFVKAVVMAEVVDPTIAGAIWATENLVRHETQPAELAAALEALRKKFGSVEEVAEQTGIPVEKVKRYLPL